MNPSLHESSTHLANLLTHLGAFDERRRKRIAKIYGAPSASAWDIAMHWCRHPSQVADILRQELADSDGWWVLSQMVQDHDLEVDFSWLDPLGRRILTDLGVLAPRRGRRSADEFETIPGALAAILAPHIHGNRVSLPILLGRSTPDVVQRLAEQYQISTAGSVVETILRIADTFSQPGFLDTILERLEDPEWIGAPMMALELGGICYWREIFGYDLEEDIQVDNVVPLMRHTERTEQREVAATLMDLGVVFKLKDEEVDFTLVAIPEELWYSLWRTGHGWLVEWTTLCYQELNELALRRPRDLPAHSTQALIKWLYLELFLNPIAADALLDDAFIDGFRRRAPGINADWAAAFALARSLGVVDHPKVSRSTKEWADAGFDVPRKFKAPRSTLLWAAPHADDWLDIARPSFARRLLSDWVTADFGTGVDTRLPVAVGLDEDWRQAMLALLEAREMPLLPWLQYPGIDHVDTGTGCLRDIGDDSDELLLMELLMTSTCVQLTKLGWLDVLSLLEPGNWYNLDQLAELLHYCASIGVFSLLEHVISNPHSNYYFPLQRPSFLTSPIHTDEFTAWCRDIITQLLEPAGLAQFDPAQDWVWLDTRNLRVPTPPDWMPEARELFMRAVLLDREFVFEMPEDYGAALRTVPERIQDDRIPVDLPLAALLKACHGREIVGFDGRFFQLAPQRS